MRTATQIRAASVIAIELQQRRANLLIKKLRARNFSPSAILKYYVFSYQLEAFKDMENIFE